jgi:hypothetical protein
MLKSHTWHNLLGFGKIPKTYPQVPQYLLENKNLLQTVKVL